MIFMKLKYIKIFLKVERSGLNAAPFSIQNNIDKKISIYIIMDRSKMLLTKITTWRLNICQ